MPSILPTTCFYVFPLSAEISVAKKNNFKKHKRLLFIMLCMWHINRKDLFTKMVIFTELWEVFM